MFKLYIAYSGPEFQVANELILIRICRVNVENGPAGDSH